MTFWAVLLAAPLSAQVPITPEAGRLAADSAFSAAGAVAVAGASAAAAEEREVARLAGEWSAGGATFAVVFQRLSSRLAMGREAPTTPAALFGGLKWWASSGGAPSLQGRGDWGLHFIYGGWLSAKLGRPAARSAAWNKEVADAYEPGNAFDVGDLAVTYLGAEWAARAVDKGFAAAWGAAPRLDLLPTLEPKTLAPRALPGPGDIRLAAEWVRSALSP